MPMMRRNGRYVWIAGGLVCAVGATLLLSAEQRAGGPGGGRGGAAALAEPFKGVTTDGTPLTGLFPIRATGVSTKPVMDAAVLFLDSLSAADRARTAFPVESVEWRDWNNIHRYERKGVSLKELSEAQRDRAFGLMRAGLSAKGFEQSRNVMRLNGYLAELTGSFDEYGEFLYHFTIDGHAVGHRTLGLAARRPSPHRQLLRAGRPGRDDADVHGLRTGLAPRKASTPGRRCSRTSRTSAWLSPCHSHPLSARPQSSRRARRANNALAQAFRDNLVLDYAGIVGQRPRPCRSVRPCSASSTSTSAT